MSIQQNRKIEYVSPSDLVPYVNNPRVNDGPAVDAVAASIAEFGFNSPIVVDKTNVVICGHTRLKAAEKLGLEQVPIVRAEDLTPAQVKAYRLADNRVAEIADWDFERLNIEIEGLKELDFGEIPGFDEDFLARFEVPEKIPHSTRNINDISDDFVEDATNADEGAQDGAGRVECPRCGFRFDGEFKRR